MRLTERLRALALGAGGRPLPAARARARGVWPPRGLGTTATFVVLVGAGVTGLSLGGGLDRFHADHGRVIDVMARAMGFPVNSIVVAGNKELTNAEIVAIAGVTGRDSVAFLDVGAVRARLRATPLIADADVRKLLPDRVAITVTEREPYALWQNDGVVKIVSADGTPIEEIRDERFLRLPHVVGVGANLRAKEYAALLEAAPDLKGVVRAGVLVAQRRWTLKLANGLEVKLPEDGAAAALQRLAELDRSDRVLGKDLISIDLRVPGRIAFRLTEEAAAARAEQVEKKLPKGKKA